MYGSKEKHPSVLDNFDKVMSVAEGKEIVVFLDYDGTLSPIVDDPDKAYMSDAVSALHRTINTKRKTCGGFLSLCSFGFSLLLSFSQNLVVNAVWLQFADACSCT